MWVWRLSFEIPVSSPEGVVVQLQARSLPAPRVPYYEHAWLLSHIGSCHHTVTICPDRLQPWGPSPGLSWGDHGNLDFLPQTLGATDTSLPISQHRVYSYHSGRWTSMRVRWAVRVGRVGGSCAGGSRWECAVLQGWSSYPSWLGDEDVLSAVDPLQSVVSKVLHT